MLKIEDILENQRMATNGMLMSVVKAYRSQDGKKWLVDVRFENGDIVIGKTYSNFKRGNIASPSVSIQHERAKKEYLNLEMVCKNGLSMKVIDFINAHNITVEFEDGIRVYNKSIGNFKKGRIEHPAYKDYYRRKYLGAESVNTRGIKMKVIDDSKGTKNLTVQFEDGTVKEHVMAKYFISGQVMHPLYGRVYMHKHIGEIVLAHNGLNAKIVENRKYNDIDIEFEDGTRVNKITYNVFKSTYIAHPKFKKVEEVYQYKGTKYFLCTCKLCKNRHVLTLEEMKDFACEV